jgi:carboxypeptidase C (cathepsin A)
MAPFRSSLSFLALSLVVGTTWATALSCMSSDHPDKVHSIPGWNMPLPSAWYSGYLDYELEGEQFHTHYVLIEAEDDEEDIKPLIYWSNGGPGASSLFGLLTEVGPLLLSDESLKTDEFRATGIPSPLYNPSSWTKLGSILIIDQPAPVGFSYCNDDDTTNPDAQNCGDIAWTDELASLNSYTALQTFFAKNPCWKEKELYLTGESYGGIYIPTLARRIVNDAATNDIQLKGFAVGDGCLGVETEICGDLSLSNNDLIGKYYWTMLFMAGHHQIPLRHFQEFLAACDHVAKRSDHGYVADAIQDAECEKVIAHIQKELGGYFVYSLYDECTYRNGLTQAPLKTNAESPPYPTGYVCGGGLVMEKYLKLDKVKEALHVRSSFFETDNAEGDFRYTPTEPDLSSFYQDINGQLKVLIYNGDTDPAINSFAAQNWTSHLGFEEIESWRPWTVDGCQRMGGYLQRYEGDFDFLTIRGK